MNQDNVVTVGQLVSGAPDAPHSIQTRSERRTRSLPIWLTWIFLVVGGLSVFFLYAHRSTQKIPEFYQVALAINPESYRAAGKQFETQILQLNTDVRNQTEWQALFSQDQVNGWLAFELPDNFPGTIPREISEPRVAISQDQIQLAFRFESTRFSGIVTATGTLFCMEHPNHIGFQIQRVRSGLVPLPIDLWADAIKKGCASAGINMMWTQSDGDTVAIVELPDRFLDLRDRRITLQNIEINDGEVVLSGTSVPIDESRRQASPFWDFPARPRQSSVLGDDQQTLQR